MICAFFVLAVVTAALAGGGDNECKKLGHMEVLKCCKEILPESDLHEDIMACKDKMAPPPNCDADICVAKRRGFAGAEDGTFDKKALESEINKEYEKKPELAETINKNCVNGDLSAFGPPDFCDLVKFRHCLQMHLVLTCTDWDSAGSCSATRELVEKCRN